MSGKNTKPQVTVSGTTVKVVTPDAEISLPVGDVTDLVRALLAGRKTAYGTSRAAKAAETAKAKAERAAKKEARAKAQAAKKAARAAKLREQLAKLEAAS